MGVQTGSSPGGRVESNGNDGIAVPRDLVAMGHHAQRLAQRLRRQQAVERVVVQGRVIGHAQQMGGFDGE